MQEEATMTIEQIAQRIRSFLLENYLFGYDENELGNDESFMELGILDSTGILELIMHIEGEFAIRIDDLEIIPENIDSVNRVSGFISKKLKV